MLKHVVIDRTTGEIIKEEPIPADVDIEAYLKQQLHDCPECRAAWERGERPTMVGPEELEQARAWYRTMAVDERHRAALARRPRWRDLKRRRG
jgi:hypothetical protein